MASATKPIFVTLALSISVAVHAQTFPYKTQVDELWSEPRQTVSSLVTYPWSEHPRISPPELNEAAHGNSIRIVSVERTPSGFSHWSHWEGADHTIWVDLLDFSSPSAASELITSAHQFHSGYIDENWLLLFTNLCDRDKDAVGAALTGRSGRLLNVGIRLEMAVCPKGTPTASDLQTLDKAIARLNDLLLTLARQTLDPAYVAFDPKISAKPEAVSLLRIAAFSRLWSEVKYNFVYLEKRPQVDWDGVLERYMPRVAAAKSDVEYGHILEEVIALLKDGHTNVYPREVAPSDAPLIRLESIRGKPVVSAVGNLPELSSVKPGMELLEIDHTPVQTIIERDLDPYIASSTPQDRALREMRTLLNGPPDSSVHTRWLDLHGNVTELDLVRNGSKNRAALPTKEPPRFEYRELPGQTIYMALNDFGNEEVAADFESRLANSLEAKAWILDLRENGGGNSDIGYRILGHFLNKEGEGEAWRTRLYNPTFRAWKQPQSWYEGTPDLIKLADGPRYSGPVFVLTSPRTCSAAEDFLIPLKIQKRATFVGEPTCGSSGQPLYFTIYGADVRICTKWDRLPDGTEFVGYGFIPDVEVDRTKEDVTTGRDTVLETAIRLASR